MLRTIVKQPVVVNQQKQEQRLKAADATDFEHRVTASTAHIRSLHHIYRTHTNVTPSIGSYSHAKVHTTLVLHGVWQRRSRWEKDQWDLGARSHQKCRRRPYCDVWKWYHCPQTMMAMCEVRVGSRVAASGLRFFLAAAIEAPERDFWPKTAFHWILEGYWNRIMPFLLWKSRSIRWLSGVADWKMLG